MKLLKFGRAFGAAFALVLVGFVAAQANVSLFWGYPAGSAGTPTQGPWLGDNYYNIYTIFVAHTRLAGVGFLSLTTISQTSAQANCTQLGNDGLIEAKTSASTGYLCLPAAIAGKMVFIGNATGQTIDLYSSATSYLAAGADTINGTIGTTAYTGLTNGKNAVCFAANNGAWYCGSIS